MAITKDDDYLQNTQKQAQVKALEREIDQMVYQLYGLTEEGIRIEIDGFIGNLWSYMTALSGCFFIKIVLLCNIARDLTLIY